MINNFGQAVPGLAMVALAIVPSAACEGASAGSPAPLQGVVEFEEQLLGFELGGRLIEREVERGDHLTPGMLIGRLDDSLERPSRAARLADAQAAQAQLDLVRAGARGEEVRGTAAELRAAQASEQLIEQQLGRQRVLAARGVAATSTQQDLERELGRAQAQRQALEQRLALVRRGARTQAVAAAEAHVAAAAAALAAVDARLAKYELHAFESGTVLDVHFERGEIVAPLAPVVTVADTHHPYVDVFAPQGELHGIRVGAPAQVRIDAETRPFVGRVEDVGRRTEFTPRYLFSERERSNLVVRIRVRVDDPGERIHAGVPAFVRITGGTDR